MWVARRDGRGTFVLWRIESGTKGFIWKSFSFVIVAILKIDSSRAREGNE